MALAEMQAWPAAVELDRFGRRIDIDLYRHRSEDIARQQRENRGGPEDQRPAQTMGGRGRPGGRLRAH